ncbi:ATP phosphoribosyltransferase [Psychroflexus sp. CAK57W]|uniref:ATP phosphoribosyltransferase n=1 Tax=Psychroflexus curvus TaxID=2873595 RepID=UPI001CC991EE|nr:ATP phosphoribosyltransferase [Psychroflexus curvus]MBZ9626788.1 ATP phosphoribosyltransferase [Psychroflexus curvus]MBZ9786563.1 ATP phosphoribosyltransferase [Psychroflexus curvus]
MEKLKIAIQKSGRLHDESLKILKDCGISINNGRDQLKVDASNFPLEIFYLRNGDIPQYLRDGIADLAIVGENLLHEKGEDLLIQKRLGFSKCKVSLAVPKQSDFKSVKDLEGKQIATSYPKTLQKFLDKHEVKANIHIINGSVEIAPNIGLADAICDIVSSGSTLFKNNLKESDVILKSEAVLTSSPSLNAEKQILLDKLLFRIDSVLRAENTKYVLLNVPNDKLDDIIKILPGMKSPTVMPLAETNWSSVHTVIQQEKFWDIIDELKSAGAESILVSPIEKMIL